MTNCGHHHGSKEWAVPVVFASDKVYVHTNIAETKKEDGTIYYEYDEVMYDYSEYTKIIQDENTKLRSDVDYLAVMGGIEL